MSGARTGERASEPILPPTPRLCACGCGRALPLEAGPRSRYARGNACRQRAHRQRVAARQEQAEESLSRALQERDLRALLAAALEQARERPGSVLIRVSGRLTTLSVAELSRLLTLLDGEPAGEPG